jgi:two-component system OmpR family sensor kinase
MSDLVEGSIDILMIENSQKFISTNIINDYIIEVDFELFTLVIKNLLDNGIKYSKNHHIEIIIDQTLKITNIGTKLNEPLENYFKPFHTSKQGLGLGLYIVKSILDIHKMELKYQYEDGGNIFVIY